MTGAARLLIVTLLSFSCLGIALAADWHPVQLKFPKIAEPDTLSITAIGIARPDQVYIATSNSRLYEWNGTTLEEIKHDQSGKSDGAIRNIVVNDENNIWALGDNGLSLEFDGKSWEPVRNPLTGTGKRAGSIWAAGCAKPDLCFAGSQSGRLIQWDGRRWEEVSSPVNDARIYGLQLTSSDFGWMVGDGFMASWNGNKWTKADLEEVPRLYGIALLGRTWGWAVGDRGIFFDYDGKKWSPATVKGSLFRLRSIACTTRTECWAVGEAGAAFRWDGTEWERVRIGTVNRLTTVEMSAGKNLIGGDKATLLQFAE